MRRLPVRFARIITAGAERWVIQGAERRIVGKATEPGVRAAIESELGESLAGREFFLHGTTAEQAANFRLEPGRRLFTATDASTASIFAKRTVMKAGKGAIGGIAVVLPREVVTQLRAMNQLIVQPISDMQHLYEWVFEPGARETIERAGEIVTLPSGTLR